jgi:hypothetical protein
MLKFQNSWSKAIKKYQNVFSAGFFFMMTSTSVIRTQIYNIKMTSSKNITKSKVRKQMAKYGFERRFHDLKYFELGFFLNIP